MTFTTAGRNSIRDWMRAQSPQAPNLMLFGSSSTAAAETDTSMVGVDTKTPEASILDFEDIQFVKFEGSLTSLNATGSIIREVGISGDSLFGRDVFDADLTQNTAQEVKITTYFQVTV